jgi:hypothetical protein
MLQQGKFVADILYYYGEDNNITALFGNKLPDIPEGYKFDFINADALINLLSVVNGRIITPSGMSYRLLALDPNSQNMSLPVLKKIRSLVKEGAIVSGPKPVQSPSLSDDQAEFQSVVSQLWINEKGENTIGQGKIYAGHTVAEAMDALQVSPDFEYAKTAGNTQLLFVHRKLAKADIYWVKNRNNREEKLETTFRIEGKIPEIWHPVTGKREPVSYNIENGFTKVPLNLEPNDAVFVVFHKKARENSLTLPKKVENGLLTVTGPWEVSFQSGLGAPGSVTMNELIAWNENPDPGVEYFSGTGTYQKSIRAEEDWFKPENELWLDLGTVKNLAEVIVNDKSLGIVWKRPFRVSVTDELKPGDNKLEIKVTNLWVNRLIGDQQPGITEKYTYTTMPFYQAESPLLQSGLLGPVQIINLSVEQK